MSDSEVTEAPAELKAEILVKDKMESPDCVNANLADTVAGKAKDGGAGEDTPNEETLRPLLTSSRVIEQVQLFREKCLMLFRFPSPT